MYVNVNYSEETYNGGCVDRIPNDAIGFQNVELLCLCLSGNLQDGKQIFSHLLQMLCHALCQTY